MNEGCFCGRCFLMHELRAKEDAGAETVLVRHKAITFIGSCIIEIGDDDMKKKELILSDLLIMYMTNL